MPSYRASLANAWFFQANPRAWNVDGYLTDVAGGHTPPELNWLVTTHEDAITIGDRVYLWRTGPGDTAGILALACIIGQPEIRGEDTPAYRRTGQEEKFAKPTCRARVRVEAIVDPHVCRTELRSTPGLEDVSILTDFRVTNIPVAPEHERLLEALCGAGRSELIG